VALGVPRGAGGAFEPLCTLRQTQASFGRARGRSRERGLTQVALGVLGVQRASEPATWARGVADSWRTGPDSRESWDWSVPPGLCSPGLCSPLLALSQVPGTGQWHQASAYL